MVKVTCSFCGTDVDKSYSTECQYCLALFYCSDGCKNADWVSQTNPDHRHEIWCAKMKCFMIFEALLQNLPFSFASVTTSSNFNFKGLREMLESIGVWGSGLWKHEFTGYDNNSVLDYLNVPGSELHLYSPLWSAVQSDVDQPPRWRHSSTSLLCYEDALVHAYVSPSYAILMSIAPSLNACNGFDGPSLFSVNLRDWSDYYSWRGLGSLHESSCSSLLLSNPLAMLLHWPLTLYTIIAHKLPLLDSFDVSSALEKKLFVVHVIGVEKEISLLPVFKELDYLFKGDMKISIVFIGIHCHSSVNLTTFHLSERLSITICTGLYHDFIRTHSLNLRKPDLIVGFNSGLAVYDTWVQTLKVISELGVPSFFTDSCLYSAILGFEMARSLGLGPGISSVLLTHNNESGACAPVLNPFRSPVRREAPGVRWGWFSNAFICSPLHYTKRTPDILLELQSRLVSMTV